MSKEWVSPTIVDTHGFTARYWLDPETPVESLRMIRETFLGWHMTERKRLHRLARENRFHGWVRWPTIAFVWICFWLAITMAIVGYRNAGANGMFTFRVFMALLQGFNLRVFWRRRHWQWENMAEARMSEALQLDMAAGVFLNALDKRITELEPDDRVHA